jgi:hypothetical protein
LPRGCQRGKSTCGCNSPEDECQPIACGAN